MDTTDQDRTLARQLHSTWDPFFARFGTLREIQRQGMPPILRGENVLLSAPTSSGKTEAACAPILQRKISTDIGSMVLYISPTRALANDLFHRLEVPCFHANQIVVRRTGEYNYAPALRKADIVITTPESFDSLLCRGKLTSPDGHILARVSAVVLDEVHLLYGTARGHQVQWLLHRLKRLRQLALEKQWSKSAGVQIVALSATVADPSGIVAAFLPDGVVVSVSGSREIETVPGDDDSAPQSRVETALPAYLRRLENAEKILVFCNNRARVDRLTMALRSLVKPIGYQVEPHHGSLDKSVREQTESEIKLRDRVIVVSSSTLEIGIDIGDIDLVVLDAPPPDIASLLQRIGRGNRRSSQTRVMLCWNNPAERAIGHAMIAAAREGWLGPAHNGPQFGAVRQQLASYTFQSPNLRRKRDTILRLVDEMAGAGVGQSLVTSMTGSGELRPRDSEVMLGQFWIDEAEYGRIHSTIDDMGGHQVVDKESGKVLASGIKSVGGRGMQTAGRNLDVVSRGDYRLEVRDAGQTSMAGETWDYAAGALLNSAGPCQALRRHLGFSEAIWPAIEFDGRWFLFHFGGSLMDATLDLAAAASGKAAVANHWYLSVATSPELPLWLGNASEIGMTTMIEARIEKLERQLARPRSNAKLPMNLRILEVAGWLQLGERCRELQSARVQVASDYTAIEILTSLASPNKKSSKG